MTLPLHAELESGAWFWLGNALSRMEAEEQIRIAFNRVRWHESVVLSKITLSVLAPGDERCPEPPPAWPKHSGLRMLVGDAVVVGHAPARTDVLGAPFLSTLTADDVTLLRSLTANTWKHENPDAPALTQDELDAAIEQLGPDVARMAILSGGVH